jgi:hypothetical protein
MPSSTPPYSIGLGLRKGIGVIILTALAAACVALADQAVWSAVIQAPAATVFIPIIAGAFRMLSNYLKVKYLG